MPRDSRDHYAASSTSARNYRSPILTSLNPVGSSRCCCCCCSSSKYPQRVIAGGTWTSSNGVKEKPPGGEMRCEFCGVRRILRLSGGISSEDGDTIDTSGILCRVSAPANGRVGRVEDPWLRGMVRRNRGVGALIDFVEG